MNMLKTKNISDRKHRNHKGIAVTEFALVLPLLVVTVMALVDVSRMIYGQQQLSDLSRETANLISRGTAVDAAINSVLRTSEAFDLDSNGLVIVSNVQRRDVNDPTPWITTQTSSGTILYGSRVGTAGGPAKIPGITDLPPGVNVTTVELVMPFAPAFPSGSLGLDFYTTELYQAAYY